MKISREGLKKLIGESVAKIVSESDPKPPTGGINWDNLTYLHRKGQMSRLNPKWQVIMTVREIVGGDMDRALAILKAAVATLEAGKSAMPAKPVADEPSEDPLDFASLHLGK